MDIIPEAPVTLFGLPAEGWNAVTLYNSWLLTAVLMALAWLGTRSLKRVPGRVQVVLEGLTGFFDEVCTSTLGEESGRKYMPFIATIFLYVMLANVMGAIPNLLAWAGWPGFRAPTQDLNTPLGLAFVALVVVHVSAIRVKGLRQWVWSFYEPSFPGDNAACKVLAAAGLAGAAALTWWLCSAAAGAWAGMTAGARVVVGLCLGGWVLNCVLVAAEAVRTKRVPNFVMAPMNIVGEMGKAISHPFRLFGNIFGGFVIIAVVSSLILYIGLPPFLSMFFDIFIGIVQAFVFAMLALAYIAVQVTD